MSDITFALEAKSNQLNAIDIMAFDRIIKIREVHVKKTPDQPVSVFFDGDNNRPWKPSKGMLRMLASAWSPVSASWVGKSAQIYCEPSVTWGGEEVGGIQIKGLTDIPAKGLNLMLTISRTKRVHYFIPLLVIEAKPYPAEHFKKALPTMAEKMKEGEMSLQQVIAQCQKTGTLSEDQLKQLEAAAPVDDNEEQPTSEAADASAAKTPASTDKADTAKDGPEKSVEQETREILASEQPE